MIEDAARTSIDEGIATKNSGEVDPGIAPCALRKFLWYFLRLGTFG